MHIHAQNHQITQEVEKDLQTQQYWSDSVLYILTSNTFLVFFCLASRSNLNSYVRKAEKSWVWHECISKPQLWVLWKIKQTLANNYILSLIVHLLHQRKSFFEQKKVDFCHRTYCWNIPAVFVTQCSSASLTLLKWSLKSFLFGIRNGRSLLHIAATSIIREGIRNFWLEVKMLLKSLVFF